MSLRLGAIVGLAAVISAGASVAVAQTPPSPPGPPQPAVRRIVADPAFALGAAYREIGRAERAGATGRYVDAAKSHYRSAIDRHGRNDDRGAAAEARIASDLARVAVDERPPNVQTGPKDIPAPPTPRPGSGRGPDGPPMLDGMWRGVHGPEGIGDHEPMIRIMHGAFGHHGFDATSLAELLKVETGAEARGYAQNAVDANAAAQKAALAGNVAEASRLSRISHDLAAVVHDIAVLNHPELSRRTIESRIFSEMMPH